MILTNPLKDLDQLHASEETKEKTLQYVLSKQRHKKTLPIWQGALVCDQCFVGYALAALES